SKSDLTQRKENSKVMISSPILIGDLTLVIVDNLKAPRKTLATQGDWTRNHK
ncbi:hypothetical protein HAX54_031083, partial [Datura stramonium]|nr:hypothetical protein [Datura stramonium]